MPTHQMTTMDGLKEGMLREDALKGKTILVTGGGTGLGKSMVVQRLRAELADDFTVVVPPGSNFTSSCAFLQSIAFELCPENVLLAGTLLA